LISGVNTLRTVLAGTTSWTSDTLSTVFKAGGHYLMYNTARRDHCWQTVAHFFVFSYLINDPWKPNKTASDDQTSGKINSIDIGLQLQKGIA
jgi:hypothetical protein